MFINKLFFLGIVLMTANSASAEVCSQFTRFNALPSKLTLRDLEQNSAYRLAVRKISADPQTIRYAVTIVARSEHGYPLPKRMTLAIHNTQDITGGCRGGFELSGDLAFFARGKISLDSGGFRYEVYNANACAGYFCTGKKSIYSLKP